MGLEYPVAILLSCQDMKILHYNCINMNIQTHAYSAFKIVLFCYKNLFSSVSSAAKQYDFSMVFS